MTETTSNHSWTIPTVGGDTDQWGQILNDFFDGELDEQVTLEGPYSERPSAADGNVKLYLATDRRIVYYNNGSSWEAVYGLGTDSNPVPGTSHFDSIETGELLSGGTTVLSSVAASGSVTLSSGTATVDTGLSAASATFYLALGVDDPNADVNLAGKLFWDDSAGTYKITIDEVDTSVGNPTANYDVLRVR